MTVWISSASPIFSADPMKYPANPRHGPINKSVGRYRFGPAKLSVIFAIIEQYNLNDLAKNTSDKVYFFPGSRILLQGPSTE